MKVILWLGAIILALLLFKKTSAKLKAMASTVLPSASSATVEVGGGVITPREPILPSHLNYDVPDIVPIIPKIRFDKPYLITEQTTLI